MRIYIEGGITLKKLRKYFVAVPTLLLLLVLFLWFLSKEQNEALLLEPLYLNEAVNSQEAVISNEEIESQVKEEADLIYVDIKGAVFNPNVYALPLGSRLFDVIDRAGGLLPNAATQQLNQSLLLSDQMLIYIYTLEEMQTDQVAEESVGEWPMISGPALEDEALNASKQLININQADAVELMTLPGIGPKKAEAIIQYRTDHGSFASPEELMEVSGIGQKTFEQLSALIRVD